MNRNSMLCQLEFKSTDIPATLHFFDKVLGWKALPITLQDYYVIEVPEDSPFGVSLVPLETKDTRLDTQATTVYFRTEKPLDILIKITDEAGGQILDGPRTVPAYGKVLRVREPGGIILGLFFPHAESILQKVE
jgi:predicted enzyme related to lactoylglutathione lyase